MSALSLRHRHFCLFIHFSFNATPTTEIYTLSLHDALPISCVKCLRLSATDVASGASCQSWTSSFCERSVSRSQARSCLDRKSTRLNSSHMSISYAVFCLKKKKKKYREISMHKIES